MIFYRTKKEKSALQLLKQNSSLPFSTFNSLKCDGDFSVNLPLLEEADLGSSEVKNSMSLQYIVNYIEGICGSVGQVLYQPSEEGPLFCHRI